MRKKRALPKGNFQRLHLPLKIAMILLYSGFIFPINSLFAANSLNNDSPEKVADQQIRVTGTIVDENRAAMPGVNIQEKGTTNGAISDASGTYSLNVSNRNATLVFSFIGFVTQEVALAGRTNIDISLASEMTGLDEVVVVGYGTQKRANVVGSVTSISGESIKNVPTPSVASAIAGRMPGSVIIQQSGEPGKDVSRILVRGRSTLGNSTGPLVVIDGVPGRTLDEVDPMDIASISVLKDASAAIYGATAANGVILVTTKRGSGTSPHLNYEFYQGFMTPTIVPQVLNAGDYATMLREYHLAEGKVPQYSEADIDLFYNGKDPWRHPNTDWYGDLIKEWTTSSRHSVTLDGGYKGMVYYVSLGLKTNEGFYKQASTKYQQYNFRTKIDMPITDWIKTSLDIAGFQTERQYPTKTGDAIVGQATRLVPTQWSFWPDGKPGPDIEYGDNPVVTSTLATGKDDDKYYKMQFTPKVTITVPWVKGLIFDAQYAYDLDNRYRKLWEQPWTLYYPNWTDVTTDPSTGYITSMNTIPTPRGLSSPQLTERYNREFRKLGNLSFNYANSFGDHEISIYGGYEWLSNDNNNFTAFRKYYISTAVQSLDAGADLDKTNTGGLGIYSRISWIARADYSYKSKYIIEVLFRRDGSLKFPPSSRWGNFPGLLLGWRASEEDFWKNNLAFINYFKLRASYGSMGMDPGSSFQYMNKYGLTTSGMVWGSGKVLETGVTQLGVANSAITWEKQKTKNIGFDSKFLNDMFHLNAEFFYNIREDILAPRDASVPRFTGIALPDENIARVDNKGFEIDAGFHKSLSHDLHFDLSGNISWNRNEVVFMDEPQNAEPWQRRTGHPYGALLLYKAIGIFESTPDADGYPHMSGAKGGDVIFEDVSGDKQITSDDQILLDKADAPEIYYGTSLDMTWKGITLSVLLQGQGTYYRANMADTRRGEAGNYFQWNFDDRWTPENTKTDVARAFNRDDQYWGFARYNSTYWYDNMAYCRLKNLVLSYDIPNKFYKRLGISNASVYVSGNNLALIYSAQRNFDPEIGAPMVYPAMKTYAIGARVNF